MIALIIASGVLGVAAAALLFLRLRAIYERDTVWSSLLSETPWHDIAFDAAQLDGLPPAARRFFAFAIRPGTPIRTVATVTATDRTTKRRHHLLVAAPFGLVSRFQSLSLAPQAGFALSHQGRRLARRWAFWIFPRRTAARDMEAQMGLAALLFAPASLLPREGIAWRGDGETAATVVMQASGASLEVEVDPEGRLAAARTRDGGMTARPSDFAERDGYLLPREVAFGGLGKDCPAMLSVEHMRFAGPWAGSSHT